MRDWTAGGRYDQRRFEITGLGQFVLLNESEPNVWALPGNKHGEPARTASTQEMYRIAERLELPARIIGVPVLRHTNGAVM